jgi:hypothetical protein
VSAAVAFDYLAQRTKNRALAAAAFYNLLVSAVSTVQSLRPVLLRGNGRWRAKAQRDSVVHLVQVAHRVH